MRDYHRGRAQARRRPRFAPRPARLVTASADAIIVGGGVIGTSIAYHLAKSGLRDIVVAERDRLGSGSTGKNAGGIRMQFSTEINVRLSQRSIPRFEAFHEEMGIDPAFHQVGYLFLITEEREVEPFERSLELWKRLGVPAERLERDAVARLVPELVTDDVLFATFCDKDGHADPNSILQGYVSRARTLGVRFMEEAPVSRIDTGSGRVTGAQVGSDTIATPLVIDAAGAWAAEVGRLVGVDLPIRPLRRQIFVTEPIAGFDRHFPLTVEFSSGLYMHRESGGVLLGMADPDDAPGYDESVNWGFLPTVVERAMARMPVLERASIRTAWGGLYEDTPDKHPIIGSVDGVEGFVCCAGFSGHGVMHAPAAGELVAELITTGKASLDLTPLRASRFDSRDLVVEHNVI